jgi:hypothetical protein
MAKYMANRVAGMDVPESLIKSHGKRVPKEKAPEEGIAICLETIAELREHGPGVHGIHLMAIEWEEVICSRSSRKPGFCRGRKHACRVRFAVSGYACENL